MRPAASYGEHYSGQCPEARRAIITAWDRVIIVNTMQSAQWPGTHVHRATWQQGRAGPGPRPGTEMKRYLYKARQPMQLAMDLC